MNSAEALIAIQAKIAKNLKVALPGIIKKYDYKKQMADIELPPDVLSDGYTMKMPTLSGVPVLFPRCGGASITFPVKQGDGCLVVFLDRDSRQWFGGTPKEKPQTGRAHSLNDAVAFVGLMPFSQEGAATNNNDLKIEYSGSKIRLTPDKIIHIEAGKKINVKTDNIVIECKSADVTVKENAIVSCKSLAITSTNNISAKCVNFNLTGKMQVTGDIVSDGTIQGNAVQTAGGIGLAGHTHKFLDNTGSGAPIPNETNAPLSDGVDRRILFGPGTGF